MTLFLDWVAHVLETLGTRTKRNRWSNNLWIFWNYRKLYLFFFMVKSCMKYVPYLEKKILWPLEITLLVVWMKFSFNFGFGFGNFTSFFFASWRQQSVARMLTFFPCMTPTFHIYSDTHIRIHTDKVITQKNKHKK